MDPQEWMYHGANIMNVIAWMVTDVLWIRTFSVFGNILALVFYERHSNLYGRNIHWHAAFILINCVQIAVLLYERRPVDFDQDEQKLYVLVFSKLSRHDYRKLMKIATWDLLTDGMHLAHQGEALQDVKIIVTGKANVSVDGRQVAQLRDGSFVGEMSFLSGGMANADVRSAGPSTHVVSWNRHALDAYLKKNPHVSHVWQHAIGMDLVSKLTDDPSSRAASGS